MSIRAYKVIEIKTEESPSFNLWRDEELMSLLADEGFYDKLVDGCGIAEVEVDALESAVKKVKDIDEDTKRSILSDIKNARKNGDSHIEYSCY